MGHKEQPSALSTSGEAVDRNSVTREDGVGLSDTPTRKAPLVTCRLVKRYFIDGKGYASAYLAYRARAKKSLNLQIARRAGEIARAEAEDRAYAYTSKEHVHAAFSERFPPCKGKCCYDEYTKSYWREFCTTARDEWLRSKIAELRALDDSSSTNPVAPTVGTADQRNGGEA